MTDSPFKPLLMKMWPEQIARPLDGGHYVGTVQVINEGDDFNAMPRVAAEKLLEAACRVAWSLCPSVILPPDYDYSMFRILFARQAERILEEQR